MRTALLLILSLASSLTFAGDGPQHAFTRYLIAIQDAESLDDVSSYLSARRRRTLAENPDEALALVKAERATMNVANVTLRQQKTTGHRAELLFDLGDAANGSKGRRTVVLIREDGKWRVDQIRDLE